MYPIAVAVVVESGEIRKELMLALEALAIPTVLDLPEIPTDWPNFLERLDRVRPDVVLLDIKRLAEPLDEVIAQLRSASSHPAVFALHTAAEPETILNALRAGASEFLFPPIQNPLKAALERLAKSQEGSQEKLARGGKTIGFLSVKGGCGASTIACHVAMELARVVNGKVLLADLDLQAGLVGFLTKAKSEYSVADAVNNLQRLDQSYWRALVSNGIPNLEIITAPSTPTSKQLPALQLKQTIGFMRTQYDWTVLDLGRQANNATLTMLDRVDETYLVTTHEIPALHQAKKLIQILLESGYGRSQLRLILNRLPKRSDITLEELEAMLGLPIYMTLANDYQALQEAFTEGRLLDGSAHLGRDFARLAAKIAGVEVKKKKFSLFG
ncbi:MAG TPA: AAA family ATPase [Bryobacteraceae bacterium]|jgi:pilus assembly protein CpaE|nr:AAA family ATPase [Bryobacteraceae bacterium]